MPRLSKVSIASRIPGRTTKPSPSSKTPSQTVLSRSQTTHFTFSVCRFISSPFSRSSKFAESRLSDHDLLHLIAPFDNFSDSRISKKPLDRKIRTASVRPMNLHRIARCSRSCARSEIFRDRCFRNRTWIELFPQFRRLSPERPRSFISHCHLCDQLLNQLMFPQSDSKLFSILRVIDARSQRCADQSGAAGSDAETARIERHIGHMRKTDSGRSENLLRRDRNILKIEFSQHRRPKSEHFIDRSYFQTVRISRK